MNRVDANAEDEGDPMVGDHVPELEAHGVVVGLHAAGHALEAEDVHAGRRSG